MLPANPTLPDANLPYQDAPTDANGQKADDNSPFVRAVLKKEKAVMVRQY